MIGRLLRGKTTMYMVNWKKEDKTLEASLGGCITLAEAQVFCDAIVYELEQVDEPGFAFHLDYSSATRLDQGVLETIHIANTYCKLRGASKFVCTARDESEIEYLTGLRLQHVLEGEEEYRMASVA